jgi:cbb3-type cytochrome oxidase maturation protein
MCRKMSDTSCDDGCDELFFPLDRIAMIWFLSVSLVGGLAGIIFLIYHMRRGQFEDPEDPKYQMFRDDEEE